MQYNAAYNLIISAFLTHLLNGPVMIKIYCTEAVWQENLACMPYKSYGCILSG